MPERTEHIRQPTLTLHTNTHQKNAIVKWGWNSPKSCQLALFFHLWPKRKVAGKITAPSHVRVSLPYPFSLAWPKVVNHVKSPFAFQGGHLSHLRCTRPAIPTVSPYGALIVCLPESIFLWHTRAHTLPSHQRRVICRWTSQPHLLLSLWLGWERWRSWVTIRLQRDGGSSGQCALELKTVSCWTPRCSQKVVVIHLFISLPY